MIRRIEIWLPGRKPDHILSLCPHLLKHGVNGHCCGCPYTLRSF
jgi:hypothetical protein